MTQFYTMHLVPYCLEIQGTHHLWHLIFRCCVNEHYYFNDYLFILKHV